MRLGSNAWGKSAVRVSKVGDDGFHDVEVQVLLEGDVSAAYSQGDNSAVLPTDTMRNTIYALAQDELDADIERFAALLADHFLGREGIAAASIAVAARQWERVVDNGMVGGSTLRRLARVVRGDAALTAAGIDGLEVLKTTGSAFSGFPRDEFTSLPEKDDRLLATTIKAEWKYGSVPRDTTATWNRVKAQLISHFLEDWSASVQHQGWLMGQAVLDAVPEIEEISFELPNQHHLPFDLSRFGIEDRGIVFYPVTEPYGDIRFTVER